MDLGLRRLVPRFIRQRFALKFAIVVLVLALTVAALGVGATVLLRDSLEDEVAQSHSSMSAGEARNLQSWSESNEQFVRTLRNARDVRMGDRESVRSYLLDQRMALSDRVQDLHYVDVENRTVAASTDTNVEGLRLGNVSAPWTRTVEEINESGPAQSARVHRTSVYRGDPNTEGSRPLLAYVAGVDEAANTSERALVVTVRPETYREEFESLPASRTVVVDEGGRIIFSDHVVTFLEYTSGESAAVRRARDIGPTQAGAMTAQPPESLVVTRFVAPDERVVVGYSQVRGTDWVVLVLTPVPDAFGFANTATAVGLVSTFSGVLIIGLVGFLFGQTIAREIDTLTDATRKVEQGQLDVDVSSDRIDSIGRLYAGVGRMTTALRERRDALRAERDRIAALFDNSSDAIAHVEWTDADLAVRSANPQFEETFGDDHSIVEATFAEHWFVTDGTEPARDGEAEFFTREVTSSTTSGRRAFLVRFVPLTQADEREGYLVCTDVTERQRYEQSLEALMDAVGSFFQVTSQADLAQTTVETAVTVLDVVVADVYLFNAESSQLAPVSNSFTDVDGLDGGGAISTATDSVLVDTFVEGQLTSVETDRQDWASPVSHGYVAPLGKYGVMAVELYEESPLTTKTRTLVDLLATTAEDALHRIESETALRERDATLTEQNRELLRLKRINETIRQIDRSLVRAATFDELMSAVCEELTNNTDFALAWIARVDADEDALEPIQWAGAGEGYLDAISSSPAAGDEPTWRAATTDSLVVVSSVVADLQSESWREDAFTWGFQSVLSVPLVSEGYTYGVLSLYAETPDRFGDRERTVFEELGETIGYAINTVETRELLLTDTLVELELEMEGGEYYLSTLAAKADCEVTYERMRHPVKTGTTVTVSVDGTPADRLRTVLEELISVDHYEIIRDDDSLLVEASVTGPLLASSIVAHGGRPLSLRATPDRTIMRVELAKRIEPRGFIEAMETDTDQITLRSRRERPAQSSAQLRSELETDLTERQLEVLESAYQAGFFEWPRAITGEELADSLGISQPTLSRHLRIAEQQLLRKLFNSE